MPTRGSTLIRTSTPTQATWISARRSRAMIRSRADARWPKNRSRAQPGPQGNPARARRRVVFGIGAGVIAAALALVLFVVLGPDAQDSPSRSGRTQGLSSGPGTLIPGGKPVTIEIDKPGKPAQLRVPAPGGSASASWHPTSPRERARSRAHTWSYGTPNRLSRWHPATSTARPRRSATPSRQRTRATT